MEISKELWTFIGAATAIAIPLLVNTTKEIIFESNKRLTEKRYIGVQLVFLLDKFTARCAAVGWDDGFDDNDSQRVVRSAQVSIPAFDLSSVKGEHKFLSSQLLYKLHLIEIKIIKIEDELRENEILHDIELNDYYNIRRKLFIELGYYVDDLNIEICKLFKIKHETWGEGESPRYKLKMSENQLWRANAVRVFKQMERKSKRIMGDRLDF